MSLLAEVAARADVPVEGVVRVVTRQPVSRRIEQRVVEVLDSLQPDQLRAVERLARAGTAHVVTPSSEVLPRDQRGATAPDPGLVAGVDATLMRDQADGLLRLNRLLEEITVRLNEMRRDHVADRQDQVNDLAVLVDLMTTGWRGVDRRLGRLERTLARLEATVAREIETPQPLVAAPREPQPIAQVAAPPLEETASLPLEETAALPPEEPPVRSRRRSRRRWLIPALPILLVAAVASALAASELSGSSDGEPRLLPATAGPAQRDAAPQTSLSSTTGGPTAQAPAATTPPPAPTRTTPARTTTSAGRTTAPPPAATTTPRATTTGPSAGITPARTFAWPPRAGSSYYLVRIYRGNKLIYEARPAGPRLVVPGSVKFTPGAYRWTVQPGTGARAQNRLGTPIVDSEFEITG